MSNILRAGAIALVLPLSLSACVEPAEGTPPRPVAGTATASEPAPSPREYYGRTEFEIPGGDGQVVDYQ